MPYQPEDFQPAFAPPQQARPQKRDIGMANLFKQQQEQKQLEQEMVAMLPNAAEYWNALGGPGPDNPNLIKLPPGVLPERNETGGLLMGLNRAKMEAILRHPKYGPALQRILARQQAEGDFLAGK